MAHRHQMTPRAEYHDHNTQPPCGNMRRPRERQPDHAAARAFLVVPRVARLAAKWVRFPLWSLGLGGNARSCLRVGRLPWACDPGVSVVSEPTVGRHCYTAPLLIGGDPGLRVRSARRLPAYQRMVAALRFARGDVAVHPAVHGRDAPRPVLRRGLSVGRRHHLAVARPDRSRVAADPEAGVGVLSRRRAGWGQDTPLGVVRQRTSRLPTVTVATPSTPRWETRCPF
jgi:hypothetical protein